VQTLNMNQEFRKKNVFPPGSLPPFTIKTSSRQIIARYCDSLQSIITSTPLNNGIQDNTVGIVIMLTAGRLRTRGSNSDRSKRYSILQSAQINYGVHIPSSLHSRYISLARLLFSYYYIVRNRNAYKCRVCYFAEMKMFVSLSDYHISFN
jgi:hypothetical protein